MTEEGIGHKSFVNSSKQYMYMSTLWLAANYKISESCCQLVSKVACKFQHSHVTEKNFL